MPGPWFVRLLPLRGPATLLVPWAIPAPVVARPVCGNSLASSPGSPLMALSGAGCLRGAAALPRPETPPSARLLGCHRPRFSRLPYKAALFARLWGWFFAVPDAHRRPWGRPGCQGLWRVGTPDRRPAELMGASWLYPVGLRFAASPTRLSVTRGGAGPAGPRWPELSRCRPGWRQGSLVTESRMLGRAD